MAKKRRGIYLKVFDYEKAFQVLNQPPIMVNGFDISKESERERLNSLIYTRCNGDTLANIPMCECGTTTGEDNIGVVCHECGFPCLPITEKPLESTLWIHVPEGIPAFMNLTVWRMLNRAMTFSGFSFLEYLTNPYYRAPVRVPMEKKVKFDRLGLPEGYKAFVEHYPGIIDALFNANLFVGNARRRKKTYRFLMENLDVTFSKVLPFPSKLGFITEENNGKILADHKMAPAIDAIWTIVSMYQRLDDEYGPRRVTAEGDEEYDGYEPSLRMKESRCVRAMCKLVDYYKEFESEIAFQKPGIARKLIYGTRPHHTYRAVITSLHAPHRYDQLELPYSLSVLLFKSHLDNKLLKREFTPNEIRALQYENTLRPHSLLLNLFDELIREAPNGDGIPTTFARNPTLKRGAIELFGIGKIKDDPSDNTVGLSDLALKAKNADFDGDALNGQLPLDNRTAKWLSRMHPSTGVMDLNHPFRVSSNIALPAPLLSTMINWIVEGDEISQPLEG